MTILHLEEYKASMGRTVEYKTKRGKVKSGALVYVNINRETAQILRKKKFPLCPKLYLKRREEIPLQNLFVNQPQEAKRISLHITNHSSLNSLTESEIEHTPETFHHEDRKYQACTVSSFKVEDDVFWTPKTDEDGECLVLVGKVKFVGTCSSEDNIGPPLIEALVQFVEDTSNLPGYISNSIYPWATNGNLVNVEELKLNSSDA